MCRKLSSPGDRGVSSDKNWCLKFPILIWNESWIVSISTIWLTAESRTNSLWISLSVKSWSRCKRTSISESSQLANKIQITGVSIYEHHCFPPFFNKTISIFQPNFRLFAKNLIFDQNFNLWSLMRKYENTHTPP